jgi:prepilin-type N-terminal cleavage/methylation domain-containing protein
MRRKEVRGFTLIEIIVVIAAIALLAGILAPLVFKNIEDARIAKARSDIKALATAVTQFYSDVGEWPTRDDNGVPNTLYALYTTGDGATLELAPGAWWPDNEDQTDPVADHLITNAQNYPAWNGSTGWNGAYLESDNLDPWGNSYLVFVLGFFEPDPDFTEVWVISAGPDGTFDTIASDSYIDPNSDDIGIRLK